MANDRFLKKFGLRIRALREKRNWTLEKAEENGGPSWTHLQRIESGKKNINLTTVLKLSRLYKMTVSELFKDL